MLNQITPVILTYNEEANLERSLARLGWARDIVIVDSLSTDSTMAIAARHAAVRMFRRQFDNLAEQWNFAIEQTGIGTEWVLALDADYVITPDLIEELRNLKDEGAIDGYSAKFRYCVDGTPLRGTIYPSVTVLFRRCRAHFLQDGHTQRVKVAGPVGTLTAKVDHDDRKPLSRWLTSQDLYMRLEAEHITHSDWSALNWPDKIRRAAVLAPFLAFAYSYFGKRVFLDGKAGLYYALQRLTAEALLALRLIEIQLKRK